MQVMAEVVEVKVLMDPFELSAADSALPGLAGPAGRTKKRACTRSAAGARPK